MADVTKNTVADDDFRPRNYQVELMKIAIARNTIIYLPTGAGKTYIAVMVLKQLSAPLMYDLPNRKMSVILVNTVALVHQHSDYLKRHTNFTVGAYTGDLNVDFWDKAVWNEEFKKNQVFVMTCQILTDAVAKQFISLDKINLIVFDECHRGVNDHSMRQLMKYFQNQTVQPRVLGLTATLLNGNCKPCQVYDQVQMLETTYHSKVATVDELRDVIGFSTNPRENIKIFHLHTATEAEESALIDLQHLCCMLSKIKIDERPLPKHNDLTYLDPDKGLSELSNLVKDVIFHIQICGTFGGIKALIAHTIQIERLKRHCIDIKMCNILNSVITTFSYVKAVLTEQLTGDDKHDIYAFSSPKVKKLFDILLEYKSSSTEELCAIIFVQRRFTAKILYHILKCLSDVNSDFSFIKPSFMVGYNCNPLNDTRETLYFNKVNKEIIQSFYFKEINLLVSSNVLEEGIDVPKCSLVVKFDAPLDYRSYIQSKGRARHKSSYYHIMVESGKEHMNFMKKYQTYQHIERQLNEFLIGQNESRDGPSLSSIQQLYDEHDIPPYYVDGPNSAQVNMVSAISLLSAYCSSLISDMYTSYAPNWFLVKHAKEKSCKVVIEMPVVCPVIEQIEGPFMTTKKQSKRAAALEACKLLHQIGELDNSLIPIKRNILDEDSDRLFAHWPKIAEKDAGNNRKRRSYDVHIPKFCTGKMSGNTRIYLHKININPTFTGENVTVMSSMYSSDLCYAFISVNELPNLCEFPLFVSAGTLAVKVETNHGGFILTEEELVEIKNFNYLVYNDVLGLLRNFLIFNNDVDMFLLVPFQQTTNGIAFNIIRDKMYSINDVVEPMLDDKKRLHVSVEDYEGKIVIPWYRKDRTEYVVTEVCCDMDALSIFPGPDDTYFDYFKSTYAYTTINTTQPMLKVKALSSRLNCFKPRGSGKRNRDTFENIDIHLIPEMVVKQDFPGPLWVQARLLPCIFDRIIQLLRAEVLRSDIAADTAMGLRMSEWDPLTVDKHLLDYETDYKSQKEVENNEEAIEQCNLNELASILSMLNTDVAAKKLNADFPWEKDEEPINIDRNLDATVMDIQYFENFISKRLSLDDRTLRTVPKPSYPAIKYEKNFVEKNIKLLKRELNSNGPQLSEIYKALATAKCNEIVNLERLETLGDSFLKLTISVYIILKYPRYDEGKSTTLKGKLVSNKNLYYLAKEKKLGEFLKFQDLKPKEEWCPPGFILPDIVRQLAELGKINNGTLLNLEISKEEQISGVLSRDNEAMIRREFCNEEIEVLDNTLSYYMGNQVVSDKVVADVVEAIIGVYLQSSGIQGGVKMLEWFNIIPKSENLMDLLNGNPPNPILNPSATQQNIDYLIPAYRDLEKALGYKFKNRGYLLQAVTHSSYTPNRITGCYQRLEFLGDAVLDFLITCHIFESCGYLNPGDLTDLRSAIVNNVTFACFAVRCGFHKYLLAMNSKLQGFIDRFIIFQESKNFLINDDVLILLNEDDLHIAEYIDVPKVLGDLFEALAGAVYLDSGMDLKTVWSVFYRIMWEEIEMFSNRVPKNAIRVLYEADGTYPEFHKPVELDDGRVMIKLDFMIKGTKKRVHGFGDNKKVAKKAAAKIALRLLGV